jgi:hypothetical protein
MAKDDIYLLVPYPAGPYEADVKSTRKLLLKRCSVCRGHGRLEMSPGSMGETGVFSVSCPVCSAPENNKFGVPGWLGSTVYESIDVLRKRGMTVYSVPRRTD